MPFIPAPPCGKLMGALMYRGHSFGGMEWDDRYQPQLLDAAAEIDAAKTDVQALLAAYHWTHDFYQAPENYGRDLHPPRRPATEKTRLHPRHRHDRRHLPRCRPDPLRPRALVRRNHGPFGGRLSGRRKRQGQNLAGRWPDAQRSIGSLAGMLFSRARLAAGAGGATPRPMRWNCTSGAWTATFGPKATLPAAPTPAG